MIWNKNLDMQGLMSANTVNKGLKQQVLSQEKNSKMIVFLTNLKIFFSSRTKR